MKKLFNFQFLTVTLFFICFNCTDEIPLETQNFEDVLVVEATLTNEFKFQEIKLSRTYLIQANTPILEDNANVSIKDDLGNNYLFTQNNEGLYVSDMKFEALPNTNYSLNITTSNGKQYKSIETQLSPLSQIDNLYPVFKDNTIKILINSNNETTDAQYFRYEYEETHKIVVPYYSNKDAILTNIIDNGKEFDIELILKTQDEKTCFTTNKSINIIQTSTNTLNNNIVSGFPIRIIDKNDSLLRERYSILVRQYVQSIEAYNFYKIINELSSSESILSESQPGYVIGNLSALNDNNEKVIGFFEVASVTSKRIYFNYLDVNIPRPPYPYDCEHRLSMIIPSNPYPLNLNENHLVLDYNLAGGLDIDNIPMPNNRGNLYSKLKDGDYYKYYGKVATTYTIVSPECGDCTSYSSNIQPAFWED